MAKQDDGLFLLEVLIDKIVFVKSPCFTDRDFRTCVNIECPNVDPLEICDDEPGGCEAKSLGPFVKTFNNGKSCLFSLKEADISKAMSKFPIKVSVYKSLPCGCLPTKIVMGEATIDMTKEFIQARKKFLEDPTNVSYLALKDSFRIVGPDNTETGEVVMFLRISCFGKLIITRFQGGTGLGANLGAGTGSAIIDRSCNPPRTSQTTDDPCACGAARGGSAGPSRPGAPCETGGGGGHGVCPQARDPYNSMPCEDPDDPCYCSGPKAPPKQQMVCRNTDQYCLHVPKDCCPPGNKVIFQLPTDSCTNGHKQRAHFNFTSDGIGDVARDEPGQLMPNTAEGYPGVVYDFPKQVIKLRIGKTVEMPGRKSKLEYQFITPTITHEKIVPVKDTRTAQCVSFCPDCCGRCIKRTLPRLPFYQDTNEENKREIWQAVIGQLEQIYWDEHYTAAKGKFVKSVKPVGINVTNNKSKPLSLNHFITSEQSSVSSIRTINSKNRELFINTHDYYKPNSCSQVEFSVKETAGNLDDKQKMTYAVYMTLFDDLNRHRTSSTQATASINKCFQVSNENTVDDEFMHSTLDAYSDYTSTYATSSVTQYCENSKRTSKGLRYPHVYFWGRKKEESKQTDHGMGRSGSKTKHQCAGSKTVPTKTEKSRPCCNMTGSASVQAQYQNSTTSAQTLKKMSSASTTTKGKVSISEPCPAIGGTKGDLVATLSHIRIGPVEPCPVHGSDPCQGPKCIVASSGEQQAPVKVTTVTNPRRGVFELVVRRMNGAPLAKNELMLEWTPPPSRPPPCGSPCPMPCSPGPCRPPKCKMIVCRPPPCRPKCCKKQCIKPCGPMPCRTVLCKKCCKASCCGKPCRPCKPCQPPPKCKPCPPSPCATPCCKWPCQSPCKSSPCLRPCPVGRRRTRRTRSQPKVPRIRPHKKRISPCLNRTKFCPVVRCRSMPPPCLACCGILPCKPLKCCKSICTTCCG